MGKRKIFYRTDLSIPQVEQHRDAIGRTSASPAIMPPIKTTVEFGRNATSYRTFDFAPWYGVGIDSITYACQRQIERFLAGQDREVEVSTVTALCRGGLRQFFDYLVLSAVAHGRKLSLTDIDRTLIDGYLGHLARLSISIRSQRHFYSRTKSVLYALGQRGLVTLVENGDFATFPANTFPNNNRQLGGETPLSPDERLAFTKAIKEAVMPIWASPVNVTSELLAYVILIVALHTGRNTTPLLELERDCLRPHPKKNITFLVLRKRRGHNTNKVALRAENLFERSQESTPTIKANVERLIRRVMTLTERLSKQAPVVLKERVFLCCARAGQSAGQIVSMSNRMLEETIKKLVAEYRLTDGDSQPLRINISRLRKTFANRIFELLDEDLASTAIALGNTPRVAGRNYLVPSENAKRDWQFMGEVLVQELLNHTIGATYKSTPMGHCSDPENGQYAPKRPGAVCFSFSNCLRCKHYAVTGEDLHKLFSFYFRVLMERARMDQRRWAQEYAYIPRLIDNYIVAEGLRRGTFKPADIKAARERARHEPHPFWSYDVIAVLADFI